MILYSLLPLPYYVSFALLFRCAGWVARLPSSPRHVRLAARSHASPARWRASVSRLPLFFLGAQTLHAKRYAIPFIVSSLMILNAIVFICLWFLLLSLPPSLSLSLSIYAILALVSLFRSHFVCAVSSACRAVSFGPRFFWFLFGVLIRLPYHIPFHAVHCEHKHARTHMRR